MNIYVMLEQNHKTYHIGSWLSCIDRSNSIRKVLLPSYLARGLGWRTSHQNVNFIMFTLKRQIHNSKERALEHSMM